MDEYRKRLAEIRQYPINRKRDGENEKEDDADWLDSKLSRPAVSQSFSGRRRDHRQGIGPGAKIPWNELDVESEGEVGVVRQQGERVSSTMGVARFVGAVVSARVKSASFGMIAQKSAPFLPVPRRPVSSKLVARDAMGGCDTGDGEPKRLGIACNEKERGQSPQRRKDDGSEGRTVRSNTRRRVRATRTSIPSLALLLANQNQNRNRKQRPSIVPDFPSPTPNPALGSPYKSLLLPALMTVNGSAHYGRRAPHYLTVIATRTSQSVGGEADAPTHSSPPPLADWSKCFQYCRFTCSICRALITVARKVHTYTSLLLVLRSCSARAPLVLRSRLACVSCCLLPPFSPCITLPTIFVRGRRIHLNRDPLRISTAHTCGLWWTAILSDPAER
ncbi:hypothetical protein B0H19DRAFT_1256299 [Mycena capillaripes]|nr:hypothetical protein B0H19DRAFT_1256299 [Mycena capillaripes]